MRRITAASLGIPQPLAVAVGEGIGISRRLIEHPSALATIGGVIRRTVSDDINEPWWNKRAIRYLSRLVRPGDRVFEWGSGGSTVWLTRQGATVTSVEHDPEWVARVRELCPTADVVAIPSAPAGALRSEAQLIHTGHRYFDDYVAAIDSIAVGSLDIVIVDGFCRIECTRRAAPKVRPGGVLIIDDTDFRFLRPQRLLAGWRAVALSGFKPRFELRETTFFHKPT